jgi:hypothetical protein
MIGIKSTGRFLIPISFHLRRADGRDWDGFLHVNPAGGKKDY